MSYAQEMAAREQKIKRRQDRIADLKRQGKTPDDALRDIARAREAVESSDRTDAEKKVLTASLDRQSEKIAIAQAFEGDVFSNPYCATRDVACSEVGVGYGVLNIEQTTGPATTHEIASTRDSSGFVRPLIAREQRLRRPGRPLENVAGQN